MNRSKDKILKFTDNTIVGLDTHNLSNSTIKLDDFEGQTMNRFEDKILKFTDNTIVGLDTHNLSNSTIKLDDFEGQISNPDTIFIDRGYSESSLLLNNKSSDLQRMEEKLACAKQEIEDMKEECKLKNQQMKQQRKKHRGNIKKITMERDEAIKDNKEIAEKIQKEEMPKYTAQNAYYL